MKVTGTATLHAPRQKVWAALNDPAVLVRTIPGCRQLEETGPDEYRMTVYAGVASVKGTYAGTVRLSDHDEPSTLTLRASGAGTPGTIDAEVHVALTEVDIDTTRLDYDADAVVGGMVGGVGQRVLTGAAKKTAGEFFASVDAVLSGRAPAAPSPEEAAARETAPAVAEAARVGAVYRAPAPGAGAGASPDFLKGALVGATVALVGVLVGAAVGRRR